MTIRFCLCRTRLVFAIIFATQLQTHQRLLVQEREAGDEIVEPIKSRRDVVLAVVTEKLQDGKHSQASVSDGGIEKGKNVSRAIMHYFPVHPMHDRQLTEVLEAYVRPPCRQDRAYHLCRH